MKKLTFVLSTLVFALLFSISGYGATYYLVTTTAAQTLASWNTLPAGGGTTPPNFTTSGDIFIISSTVTSATFGASTAFGTGVTLQIDGTGVVLNSNVVLTINGTVIFSNTSTMQLVTGGGSSGFVLSSGATLITANANGMAGTGNPPVPQSIGHKTGSGTSFNTGANYVFNGSGNQSSTGLPTSVNNLTLSGSGTKTISTTVNGTLTFEGSALISATPGFGGSATIAFSSDTARTVTSVGWPAAFAGTGGVIISKTGTITLNENKSVNALTINSGATLADGGFALTLSGNLSGTGTHTGSGSISMTGSGATISGATLSNLTLNNVGGFSLSGSPTVNGTLTLSSGALSIGANTLTLNGAVSVTTGSLSGGSTSNITFGGSGESTTLPVPVNTTLTLGNLTINRANGIALGGNLTVSGTYTASSGAFDYGNYNVSLNGDVTVSSGTITTSAAGTFTYGKSTNTQNVVPGTYYNLTFSAFTKTLPASTVNIKGNFTTGNISGHTVTGNTIAMNGSAAQTITGIFTFNNLTINSTGGVTSGSDITVNGTLNLTSANPAGTSPLQSTKGTLEMGANTLTMSTSALTDGIGDVTGTIKRTGTFDNSSFFTFGNKYTTVKLTGNTDLTGDISVKVSFDGSPKVSNGVLRS